MRPDSISTASLSAAAQCVLYWQQQLALHVQQQRLLAVTAQGPKSYAELAQDVAGLLEVLQGISATQLVLWSEDSYPFLAGFLATLIAGKTLILPPNNIQKTLSALEADGAVVLDVAQHLARPRSIAQPSGFDQLNWLDIAVKPSIVFFSSGSTAAPKRIPRSLLQLLFELESLQQVFQLPADAIMIATVSQQHIYGLLFKLLWPVQQGAAFYDQQLAYPEHVLYQAGQWVGSRQPWLVSSPAFLKRWQAGISAWPFRQLISSGGVLPLQARALFDVPLTEVLGSTETGGMAYRSRVQPDWQPFPDVSIRIDDGALYVRSRHAYMDDWVATGDSAQPTLGASTQSAILATPQGFELGSRLDRIVKLEEKRLSLDAIEAALCEQDAITEAHVLLVEPVAGRQQLGCVCVLTKNLHQQLQKIGKKAIVRQIKQQLTGQLESIAMPRQWRFVRQMPTNSQAKLNKQDIRALFMSQQLPLATLVLQQEQQHIHLELEFLPEQLYFQGHFPEFPVYPGVAQIALVDAFAQQYFAVSGCCTCMEQIKFMRLIRPYDVLQLVLERNDNKVIFRLYGELGNVASGRLIYDAASQKTASTDACAS